MVGFKPISGPLVLYAVCNAWAGVRNVGLSNAVATLLPDNVTSVWTKSAPGRLK